MVRSVVGGVEEADARRVGARIGVAQTTRLAAHHLEQGLGFTERISRGQKRQRLLAAAERARNVLPVNRGSAGSRRGEHDRSSVIDAQEYAGTRDAVNAR